MPKTQRPKAIATPGAPQYKSGLERRYAAQLAAAKANGGIFDWAYEPESLVLAQGARYTPDFRVVLNDGVVEFHETKGYRREAAIVRLKVAARLHPYIFRLVTWNSKTHTWASQLIPA